MKSVFFDIFFLYFVYQESELLTSNLGEHMLSKHEVLQDVSDLKTLANLQESMVRAFEY